MPKTIISTKMVKNMSSFTTQLTQFHSKSLMMPVRREWFSPMLNKYRKSMKCLENKIPFKNSQNWKILLLNINNSKKNFSNKKKNTHKIITILSVLKWSVFSREAQRSFYYQWQVVLQKKSKRPRRKVCKLESQIKWSILWNSYKI